MTKSQPLLSLLHLDDGKESPIQTGKRSLLRRNNRKVLTRSTMRKTWTEVPIGENQVRMKIRIEGENAPEDSKVHQLSFLTTLIQTPDLLSCGYYIFQKLSIYHNGERWIAEAEAVVDNKA